MLPRQCQWLMIGRYPWAEVTGTAVEFAFEHSAEALGVRAVKIPGLSPEVELFVRCLGIPPNIKTSRLRLLWN